MDMVASAAECGKTMRTIMWSTEGWQDICLLSEPDQCDNISGWKAERDCPWRLGASGSRCNNRDAPVCGTMKYWWHEGVKDNIAIMWLNNGRQKMSARIDRPIAQNKGDGRDKSITFIVVDHKRDRWNKSVDCEGRKSLHSALKVAMKVQHCPTPPVHVPYL